MEWNGIPNLRMSGQKQACPFIPVSYTHLDVYKRQDINRFFSTLKQAMDNIGKVRMELAHKYYALAEVKPDLKVDLFSSEMPEIDLNRIQRVSVFKTKQDGIQCVATIDGQKQPARSVTPQQWQRMWIAEERDSYKRHLAATLFADVLQKGQSQEAHTGEKQQKEAELWPIETVAQERTESDNKGISPERQLALLVSVVKRQVLSTVHG